MSATWKTKDGRTIAIRDMDDGHLTNTIRFLERAHTARVRQVILNPPAFQGEMAQLCADAEYNALLESEPGDVFPVYHDLVQEQQRRKLT
jgi:hypothetical protein